MRLNKFILAYIVIATLISLTEGENYLNNTKEGKKIVFTKNAPEPIGPYSQAILCGDLLFISGQVGIDPESGSLLPSIGNQTRQAMENLKAILKQADMGFGDVMQTRIYLTDMADFQKVNEIYASYFEGDYPARSTLQIAALPKNALVEIEMTAVKAENS